MFYNSMQSILEIGLRSAVLSEVLARGTAYLDPGSGSYLLQLLVAGLFGGALALRAYWSRIKGFFSNLLSRGVDDEQGD